MAKKGLVNKLVFGEDNKKDFTSDMLPKSRKKQFFYLIKNNFARLFTLNIINLICFAPAICWYIISLFYVSNKLEGLSTEEVKASLLYFTNIQYLPLIPLFIIGFVSVSATNFVLRKMMWDEVVVMKNDLKKGLHDSYLSFILIGFLFGFYLYLFHYCFNFLLLSAEGLGEIILAISILIIYLILLIALFYKINLASLYKLTFIQLIKNSLILTFKELFRNIAVLIISIGIVIVWLYLPLPQAIFKLIPFFLLAFGGFTYIFLMFGELSMYSFDRYINKKHYFEFVYRGLGHE